MAEVIMTCGRICSGKSTYAQKLRTERNAVILSVDEITLRFFPMVQAKCLIPTWSVQRSCFTGRRWK